MHKINTEFSMKKEVLAGLVGGLVVNVIICGLAAAFILPMPADHMGNIVDNMITGGMAGSMAGLFGVLLYLKGLVRKTMEEGGGR